jgi:hypothetical protein
MSRRAMLASLYDPRYQKFVNVWYFHDLKRRYPRLCALYPPGGVSAVQVATEDPLRRIIRDAVAHHTPVCALNPAGSHMWFKTPLFLDEDGSRATLEEFLKKHYQTAQIGLLMQVYPADQKPSAAFVSAETARVWNSYTLRGVFDGDLQKDQYLAPLAVNYGNSSLAQAHVLSLFQSDEAAQGLELCRQHTGHNAAVASTQP